MLIDYQKVNIVQDGNVVLKDVCLQVNEGDFVYIIGKVGSGKSSLLKTLYCELDHDEPEKAMVDEAFSCYDLKVQVSQKRSLID